MTDQHTAADPNCGHGLVDRLLTLHPPKDNDVAAAMDAVRGNFIDLGHTIVHFTPEGPDQRRAIYKLHEAGMAAIAAIACNQETQDAQAE